MPFDRSLRKLSLLSAFLGSVCLHFLCHIELPSFSQFCSDFHKPQTPIGSNKRRRRQIANANINRLLKYCLSLRNSTQNWDILIDLWIINPTYNQSNISDQMHIFPQFYYIFSKVGRNGPNRIWRPIVVDNDYFADRTQIGFALCRFAIYNCRTYSIDIVRNK